MVIHRGIEPRTPWLKVTCSTDWANESHLAGVAGFEPTNDGIKIRCLTAWRHPYRFIKWGGRWESNPRPQGPQSCALTNWATPAILVRLKGFEPLTLGLEGRCSILLSYRCIPFCPQNIVPKLFCCIVWSGWWESDPRSQLGRLEFYHWTTPAPIFCKQCLWIISKCNFNVNCLQNDF